MFIKVCKSKNISNTILGLSVITFLFCFNSCSNFLDGSKLKDEITASIEYSKYKEQKIKVFSSEGKISPSSTDNYKKTDEISLSFAADTEYFFAYWSVSLGNKKLSVEEMKKYFDFDDYKKSDTNVRFIEYPDSGELLTIEPVCIKRPVILNKTPSASNGLVVKDSGIFVVFDNDIEPDSFYYTDEEVDKIRVELSAEGTNEVDEWDLNLFVYFVALSKAFGGDTFGEDMKVLLYLENDSGKYYKGYVDNGKLYYKNIKITDYYGNSLLDNFYIPYLVNPRMLVINAYSSYNGLKDFSTVCVEISKDMYSMIDGYKVSLGENEKWTYTVNNEMDKTNPILKTSNVFIRYSNSISAGTKKYKYSPLSSGLSEIKKLFLYDSILKTELTCFDNESCPNNRVTLKYRKVKDNYYSDVDGSSFESKDGELSYADNAMIASGTINFDLSDIDDGIYQAYLEVSDIAGNVTESRTSNNYSETDTENSWYYYFIVCKEGMKISENNITSALSGGNYKITVAGTSGVVFDNYTKYRYVYSSGIEDGTYFNQKKVSQDIEFEIPNTAKKVRVYYKDIFDKESYIEKQL